MHTQRRFSTRIHSIITKVNFVQAAVCGREAVSFVLIFLQHYIRLVHLHFQVWLTTLKLSFYSMSKERIKSACLCDVTQRNAFLLSKVRMDLLSIFLPAQKQLQSA